MSAYSYTSRLVTLWTYLYYRRDRLTTIFWAMAELYTTFIEEGKSNEKKKKGRISTKEPKIFCIEAIHAVYVYLYMMYNIM